MEYKHVVITFDNLLGSYLKYILFFTEFLFIYEVSRMVDMWSLVEIFKVEIFKVFATQLMA